MEHFLGAAQEPVERGGELGKRIADYVTQGFLIRNVRLERCGELCEQINEKWYSAFSTCSGLDLRAEFLRLIHTQHTLAEPFFQLLQRRALQAYVLRVQP